MLPRVITKKVTVLIRSCWLKMLAETLTPSACSDCREAKDKTKGALNSVEVKQLYFHSYQSMGFKAFDAFISWFL